MAGEFLLEMPPEVAALDEDKPERVAGLVLHETPVNNHGCRGFEVKIIPLTDDLGLIAAGESCSSCWQVGHDDAASPIAPGTVVRLPQTIEVVGPSDGPGDGRQWSYHAPVWTGAEFVPAHSIRGIDTPGECPTWEQAAMPCGHSHNELIDDSDEPQPDCTLVGLSDLHIVSEALVPLFEAVEGHLRKWVGFGELRAVWRALTD